MRIVIACGGSGGHIFPAIGLAQTLSNRGHKDIIFISDDNAIAENLISGTGFDFTMVKIPKMPYGFSIKWLSFIGKLVPAYLRAERVLLGLNPDLVVGFGAYTSGVIVHIAKSRHIKTVIHEQNVKLGRANRMLLSNVDRACFSFSNSLVNKDKRFVLTGNPLRQNMKQDFIGFTRNEIFSKLGLTPNKKTLLVMGGSQGSGMINKLFLKLGELLDPSEKSKIQIIHLTGDSDLAAVSESYIRNGISYYTKSFYDRISWLYKIADIAVCRSGATTVSEIMFFKIPAIFIPYPWAGSHQKENAEFIARLGAGVKIDQERAEADKVRKNIFDILNSEKKIKDMKSAMDSLARVDAADRLADVTEELIDVE